MNPHNRNQPPSSRSPPNHNHHHNNGGRGRGPSSNHRGHSTNAEMIAPGLRIQKSYHLVQQEKARKLQETRDHRSSIQQFQPQEQPFIEQQQRGHNHIPPNRFQPPHHQHLHRGGGRGRGRGPPPPHQPRYPHQHHHQQQQFSRNPGPPNHHQPFQQPPRENNHRHPPQNIVMNNNNNNPPPAFRRHNPPPPFAARPPPHDQHPHNHQGMSRPPSSLSLHRSSPPSSAQPKMYREPRATQPLAVAAAQLNPPPQQQQHINQEKDNEGAFQVVVPDSDDDDDEEEYTANTTKIDNNHSRAHGNNNINDNAMNNANGSHADHSSNHSEFSDMQNFRPHSRSFTGTTNATSAAASTEHHHSSNSSNNNNHHHHQQQGGMLKQAPPQPHPYSAATAANKDPSFHKPVPKNPAATSLESARGQAPEQNNKKQVARNLLAEARPDEEGKVIYLSSDDEESDDDSHLEVKASLSAQSRGNMGSSVQREKGESEQKEASSVNEGSSSSLLFSADEAPDAEDGTGIKDDEDIRSQGGDDDEQEASADQHSENSTSKNDADDRNDRGNDSSSDESDGSGDSGSEVDISVTASQQKKRLARKSAGRQSASARMGGGGRNLFTPRASTGANKPAPVRRTKPKRSNYYDLESVDEEDGTNSDSESEEREFSGNDDGIANSNSSSSTQELSQDDKAGGYDSSEDESVGERRKQTARKTAIVKQQRAADRETDTIDIDSSDESSDDEQQAAQQQVSGGHSKSVQAQGMVQRSQQQLLQNRQLPAQVGRQPMAPYYPAASPVLPVTGYGMSYDAALMQAQANFRQTSSVLQRSISIAQEQDQKKKRKLNEGDVQPGQQSKEAKKKRTSSSDSESEAELCESDASSEIECEMQVKSPSPFGVRRPRRRREQVDYTAALMSPEVIDDDGPTEMSKAKHVVEVNPETGRPVGKITCYGGSAEILYDFRVDIAPSKIPNSGLGAFLTFLGARHLKDEAYAKKGPKLDQKPLELEDSLEAVGEDGYGIHVTLAGESIDETKTLRPDGIGPERIYTESDYEDSETTVFSSKGRNNGLIHLGRYGPFTPRDRIPTHHFDVKSFVLGYEPSEWCFGVEENLFGREEQIIDITDNLTGKTHAIAQRNLPMYVNEVGHNPALTQTVSSRTRHDRSVHYYIDIDRPMKKGQTIELLTNYDDTYEDIRLRKGYGLMSLPVEDGVGDDSDPKELLIRNCDLRGTIVLKIRELDVHRIYAMMEYIEESIHAPIRKLTKQFIEDTKGQVAGEVPLCRQWVALLRLQWVGDYVLKHLVGVEERLLQSTNNTSSFNTKNSGEMPFALYPWKGMVAQCREWAEGMKPVSFIWDFMERHPNLCDADGNNILSGLKAERVEAMWYECSPELKAPLNASVWCPIAVGLIERLSGEVETNTVTEKPSFCIPPKKILSAAVDAAEKIKAQVKSFPGNSDGLEFEAGVPAGAHASIKQVPANIKPFWEGNCQNPKGLLAVLCELLAYVEASHLIDLDQLLPQSFSLPLEKDAKIVMTRYGGFEDESQLASVPKTLDATKKNRAQINETWYIVWQVIFVVNAIAEHYLPRGGDFSEEYSLEKLCTALGIDLKLAQSAIEQRIQEKTLMIHSRKKSGSGSAFKSSGSARKRTVNHDKKKKEGKSEKTGNEKTGNYNAFGHIRPAAIEIGTGPPDEPLEGGWPPGWVRKVFERQSGASKGHRDRYWYSPKKEYKFRSMKEVKTFLSYLRMVGGDEESAHKLFKGKGKK